MVLSAGERRYHVRQGRYRARQRVLAPL